MRVVKSSLAALRSGRVSCFPWRVTTLRRTRQDDDENVRRQRTAAHLQLRVRSISTVRRGDGGSYLAFLIVTWACGRPHFRPAASTVLVGSAPFQVTSAVGP